MGLTLDAGALTNLFPASPTNHVVQIQKFPHLSFMVQEVNVPGVSTPAVMVANPRTNFPVAPTKIHFEPLVVRFLLDEDFLGYKEIHRWMTGITDIDETYRADQFYNEARVDSKTPWAATNISVVSTHIGLTIVNANKTPIIRAIFYNAQPTNLSEVGFSTTIDNLTVMTASVTFVYDSFQFITLR